MALRPQPRTPCITGIDHLLVGAANLEDARGAWLRLGFTITPRGRRVGWGTANYCVVFPREYIELLGIVDPEKSADNLDRFLAEREGLMRVAFAAENGQATVEALRAAGIRAEGPRKQSRILELPQGEMRPAFELIDLPESAMPGLSAFVCHHLTPELIWREQWCRHPNGARSIRAVTAVVEDPSAVAIPYGEMFGYDRVVVDDGFVTVNCDNASIRFAMPGTLRRLHPVLTVLPSYRLPWLAAVEVGVEDPEATARYLEAVRLPFLRLGEHRLSVAPIEAGGVIVDFAGV